MPVRELPISELQPGMLLAQPVLNDKGRTVIPEDSRLTPMHLKRLEKWGIEKVSINDDDTSVIEKKEKQAAGQLTLQNASAEDREAMRNIALAIQTRFSNLQGNEIMDELKRLTVRHLVMAQQEGKALPGVSFT